MPGFANLPDEETIGLTEYLLSGQDKEIGAPAAEQRGFITRVKDFIKFTFWAATLRRPPRQPSPRNIVSRATRNSSIRRGTPR